MKISRNSGVNQNVTTELSLQLNPKNYEVLADLKWNFPPLIMSPSKGLIPLSQKHPPMRPQKPLSYCLLQNNTVSLMEYIVGDDISVLPCH